MGRIRSPTHPPTAPITIAIAGQPTMAKPDVTATVTSSVEGTGCTGGTVRCALIDTEPTEAVLAATPAP